MKKKFRPVAMPEKLQRQRFMMGNSIPRLIGVFIAMFLTTIGPTAAQAQHRDDQKAQSWVQFSYEPYPLPYYIEDADRYPAATLPDGAV
ncbi:MAG: hypothetical protein AAF607_00890, partial [Pseudomonadota bacterium]